MERETEPGREYVEMEVRNLELVLVKPLNMNLAIQVVVLPGPHGLHGPSVLLPVVEDPGKG